MVNSVTIVLLVIAVGWYVAKWYRPSYEYLRDRPVDAGMWERRYPAEVAPFVHRVLKTIRDAFLLRKNDVCRLRPEDRLLAIYRAAYPKRWQPDTLEFETLCVVLNKRFHVPQSELAGLAEMSVSDVVQLCIVHRRAAD